MRKTFLKQLINILVLVATCVFSNILLAQDDNISEILACDQIKNSEDRLKCFDTAVRAAKQEQDVTASSQVADRSSNGTESTPPSPNTIQPPPTPEESFGGIPRDSLEKRVRRQREEALARNSMS